VSKRAKLAYEEDKGEVAQHPQGGDENVRWPTRSMLSSLLISCAGFMPCLKELSLPMSRIKVRLPSAPRVEMIM
jgi:hypothetical protein